ncbi:hypothetical protein B0H13DRAFT_1867219 [Mycena leptocephala]|nr:hypothetical protein B0H13DRAFT_1867219 [Mycena leptocephala]
MPHSSSPTPPSSPRPLHDLLALAQQLTPSKSPRTVRRLRQQLQVQANEAQQEHANLKRRAVDAEQQVNTTWKPQKMRKHGDRARDADDSEAIFLIDDNIMNTEEDNSFDFNKEFDSTKTSNRANSKDQAAFLDGLHSQRSSMGYHVRTEALQYIVDNVKLFATSASRFDAFSKLIGYKPATNTSQAFYDRFEVPLLYDKWDGTINVNTLFRGNVVLEVYVSCICGRHGAQGLFKGKSKLLQAKCLERIHKITRTMSGAIVTASILAIWFYSADTQLVKVSDETTIDYGYRYRVYIRRIREGLHDKKAWAIGLLQYCDRILFPNADKSREHDAAGNEELDDDEDLNDIFGQAPSAALRTIPQITSPPQDNHKDGLQSQSSSPSPPPHSRHFLTSSLQLPSSSQPSSAQPSNPPCTTSWTLTIPAPAMTVRHQPVPPMGASRQSSSRRATAPSRSHNNERRGR